MPHAIASQQTRELLQERRSLADVESEESAMTEEIVENLLKRKAKK